MHILWIILIGFVAGVIAKLVMPGDSEPQGFILTTILGIVGAFVATYLGQAIGRYGPDQGAGLVGAVVGAVLILLVWGFVDRRHCVWIECHDMEFSLPPCCQEARNFSKECEDAIALMARAAPEQASAHGLGTLKQHGRLNRARRGGHVLGIWQERHDRVAIFPKCPATPVNCTSQPSSRSELS